MKFVKICAVCHDLSTAADNKCTSLFYMQICDEKGIYIYIYIYIYIERERERERERDILSNLT